MTFLIAYDIADPRRLRRVARFFDRWAVRCQKSVFLYEGNAEGVVRLLDAIAPRIDPQVDCVQAWKLAKGQPDGGIVRGRALPLRPAGAVLLGGQALLIE